MPVGRNGAPMMAVRCPTCDSASGDHIMFEFQQRSFSSFSFHHRSLSLSSQNHRSFLSSRSTTGDSLLPRVSTGASLLHQATSGASLLHRSTTACRSFSSSSSHHLLLVTDQKGQGPCLKDILSVAYNLTRKMSNENLKLLHTILFARRGKAAQIKTNILGFSGFVWHGNEEKEKEKIKEKLDKCNKENLWEFCDLFDIHITKATTKKSSKGSKHRITPKQSSPAAGSSSSKMSAKSQ